MKIEGYTLVAPLGAGGHGLIWRVTDRAGNPHAAKLIVASACARADAFARAGLCGIETIAPADLGRVAVISRLVRGDDLDAAARDEEWRTRSARVVCAQVARHLARIHAAGLAHGDVAPANIHLETARVALIDPLLDGGAGTPHYRPPEGGPPSPAGDVYALGVIAADLGITHPLLEAARRADPTTRPTAVALARALHQPKKPQVKGGGLPRPADPIRAELARPALARTRPATTRTRPARRRTRVGIIGVAAGLALIVGGLAALVWPGISTATAPTTDAPAEAHPLNERISNLVAARDAALVSGDRVALAAITEEGSPARAEDDALAEALAASGVRLEGLATEVSGVVEEAADAGSVTVSARLRQQAHRRCTSLGCEDVPAQPARAVHITLDARGEVVRSIAASG